MKMFKQIWYVYFIGPMGKFKRKLVIIMETRSGRGLLLIEEKPCYSKTNHTDFKFQNNRIFFLVK